ncbi:ABC transporter permease [Gleimia hominis]|uniref:ABC transporter permease n=1 Tax=Gleimia hominis TaxID=595468 RepID=A0ABU3IA68_9ACTO|nr:ABC transporter permease [Gleimia hominis]MDT3767263.1 ABC transporter permease [Gleimia hominis]
MSEAQPGSLAPTGVKPPQEPKQNQDQHVPMANRILKRIFSISTATILAAIALSLVIGAVIVVIFNEDVQTTAGYLLARPSDFLSASWNAFSGFFSSLFRGAVVNYQADSFAAAIKPFVETLTRSVPLILAGLAVAVSFRAGLFNIGVQGQLAVGALCGTIAGIHLHLPIGLHLLVAIICAILGGAIWGGIPGALKSWVGANEVIVTIMLNSIAAYLVAYMLKQKFLVGEGVSGKSQYVADAAMYPRLLGSTMRLDLSFLLALGAAVFVWWLLERSTFGFELRAAGANPAAARTAGISVRNVIFLTLVISGALAGLAGTAPVLGTERFLTNGTAGSYGFDAITVALLGKSTPLGTVLAGILFGGLAAGASTMQSSAGIPVDIVQITQAVIVLLIAASEAVRYFREKRSVQRRTSAAATEKGETK